MPRSHEKNLDQTVPKADSLRTMMAVLRARACDPERGPERGPGPMQEPVPALAPAPAPEPEPDLDRACVSTQPPVDASVVDTSLFAEAMVAGDVLPAPEDGVAGVGVPMSCVAEPAGLHHDPFLPQPTNLWPLCPPPFAAQPGVPWTRFPLGCPELQEGRWSMTAASL